VLKAEYEMVKHTQKLGIASACEESDLSMKCSTSKVPYIKEPIFLLVFSVFLVSLTVVVRESQFIKDYHIPLIDTLFILAFLEKVGFALVILSAKVANIVE